VEVDTVGGDKTMPPRSREAYTVRFRRCRRGAVAAIVHS